MTDLIVAATSPKEFAGPANHHALVGQRVQNRGHFAARPQKAAEDEDHNQDESNNNVHYISLFLAARFALFLPHAGAG